MKYTMNPGRKAFLFFSYLIVAVFSISCLLPFIHLFAVSLSGKTAVAAGSVGLLPIGFTLSSYQFVIKSPAFLKAFGVTIARVVLGTSINMLLIVLTAYPLSKDKSDFKMRNIYAWFFVFTMMFSGGLVPWYMVIKYTGLLDTIWALVLPGALPVFSMLIVLNFFRGLPKELEEAALIDGAGYWTCLWRIIVPLSKPSLATVALFGIVGHWNSWFDGLILMNSPSHYPLQSYLQTIIQDPEMFFRNTQISSNVSSLIRYVNNSTVEAAELFVATIPILIVYPFLQKYFTTGLVLGSVKG